MGTGVGGVVGMGEGMRVLVAMGMMVGSDVEVGAHVGIDVGVCGCGIVGVCSIPAWVKPQAIESVSRAVNRRRNRLARNLILQGGY